MDKETRAGLWIGVCFAIISALIQSLQWAEISPAFLEPYASYIMLSFVFAGTAIIALIVHSRYSRKDQLEKTTQQRPANTSRLRVSVRKERRMDFWMIAFVLVIVGPMFIMMIFSFPSEPLSPQFSLSYQAIKIIAIGMGISFTVLGIWMASNLILDTWESRQQLARSQKNTYAKLTKDFDNAFDAVQQVSEPNTKLKMLYDFQDQLGKLGNKYEWNQLKDRVDKVFQCLIPDMLSNAPLDRRYIQILAIILDCCKANVVNTINIKWAKELEKLYNDPEYRTDDIAIIFGMLQELHGYREDYLEKIIDDSVTQWTQLKFSLLAHNIGFAKLRELDEAAYLRVFQYVRRKMEQAAQANREEERKRIETIYDIAKK